MADELQSVVAQIDAIDSVEDEQQLEQLGEVVERLFARADAATGLPAVFRLFERFPEQDAYGVFWTALHGAEGLPGYEPLLIQSVQRRPSRFGVMMVGRLLAGGVRESGDVALVELLELVADRPGVPESVREDARRSVEEFRGRT